MLKLTTGLFCKRVEVLDDKSVTLHGVLSSVRAQPGATATVFLVLKVASDDPAIRKVDLSLTLELPTRGFEYRTFTLDFIGGSTPLSVSEWPISLDFHGFVIAKVTANANWLGDVVLLVEGPSGISGGH